MESTIPLLAGLLLGAGCTTPPEQPPAITEAPLSGVVYAPDGAGGVDVVPFAEVQVVDGPATTTDATGRFALPAVPVGDAVLEITGPGSGDNGVLEIHGPTSMVVSVPPQGLVVAPHLLPGCIAHADAAGGSASAGSCGGGGAVQVELPADGVVTAEGDPVEGLVRVEMTALDPDDPAATIGLPADGLGAAGPAVFAGGSVTLWHGGDPVRLAPEAAAEVRLELAELPEGTEASDLVVQWYDPDAQAWVDDGTGTVMEQDGQQFYAFTATHFSTRRIASTGPLPDRTACLVFEPYACPSGFPAFSSSCGVGDACLPTRVTATVTDPATRRSWQQTVTRTVDATGASSPPCLDVPAGRLVDVVLRAAHPLANLLPEQPVYSARFGARADLSTGPASCPEDCAVPGVADNQDRIGLCALQSGCATGTALLPDGRPMRGPIQVLVEGQQVGALVLPDTEEATCDGAFCTTVPMRRWGDEVVLRDAAGHEAAFAPSADSSGGTCTYDTGLDPWSLAFCTEQPEDADPGCAEVGTLTATCTDTEQGCLDARFTAWLGETCGGDGITLHLDASESGGEIARYRWFLFDATALDAAEADDTLPVPDPVDAWSAITPETSLCIAEGEWEVRLRVEGPGRTWAQASQRLSTTLYPGPCAESITREATGSTDRVGSCTYTWNGTALDSRTCVAEGPSSATFEVMTGATGAAKIETVFAPDLPCGLPCSLRARGYVGNLGAWGLDVGVAVTTERYAEQVDGDFTSEIRITRDAAGNADTVEEVDLPGEEQTAAWYYAYDGDAAQPDAVRWYRAADDLLFGSWTLARPEPGRTVMTGDDGTVVTLDRDAAGRPSRLELTTDGNPFHTRDYHFDAAGNLQAVVIDHAYALGTSTQHRTFDYSCW